MDRYLLLCLCRRLLELGASRPWQEALQKMTGSREISASALLEYFRPLEKWLKFNNDLYNEKLGWKGAKINWKSEWPFRLLYLNICTLSFFRQAFLSIKAIRLCNMVRNSYDENISYKKF